MIALVTGGTGFIGSHLAEHLQQRGFEVICSVRDMNKLKWLQGKPYRFIQSDLIDTSPLKNIVSSVDYIFHIAGTIAAKDYNGYLSGNRDITKNMLDLTIKNNKSLKRFVYLSSQTASGPSFSLDNPIDESFPCKPITQYGKSKLAAEEEVLKAADSIPITIIRPTAVFGPRDPSIFTLFKAASLGIGAIFGIKDKYLSLAYPTDLCRGIIDAALCGKALNQIYYLSSDKYYTYTEMINHIRKAMDNKFMLKIRIPDTLLLSVAATSGFTSKLFGYANVFNYEKGVDFIQKYWICSIEKAKKDFAYKQTIPIEQAIFETVSWYKQNKWL